MKLQSLTTKCKTHYCGYKHKKLFYVYYFLYARNIWDLLIYSSLNDVKIVSGVEKCDIVFNTKNCNEYM